MYCHECGTKNDKDDDFCSECGTKLEKEDLKKPMSSKTKIIIITCVSLIVIFAGLFLTGKYLTGPKRIAKDYIDALVSNNVDKLYNYLNIEGDKTFISKSIFKQVLSEENKTEKIKNIDIKDVEYSDDKTEATVNFTYTVEGKDKEYNDDLTLVKSDDKKFIIFDDWKVKDFDSSNMILKDYEIRVNKDSKITFLGIDVKDKYKDKEKSTTTEDVYIIPQVFMSESDMSIKLSNGLEVKTKVYPTNYSKTYKFSFNKNLLTEEQNKLIEDEAKNTVNTIYNGIVDNKSDEDLKLTIDDFKDVYSEIKDDLDDKTLTKFDVTDISLYSASIDSENNLKIKLRIKYDYTIKYKSFDEEKTNESDSSDYITFIYKVDNGEFSIKSIDDLDLYFSKYF